MSHFDDPVFCRLIEAMLPAGGLVVALNHVYLDESGTHDGAPIMTMAGYMFRAEQARKFTRDWSRDLQRLGLPFAHMTDCATGNGHYADMTLEKRIQSEKLLIENIRRRTLFGFGVSLEPEHYMRVMEPFGGKPSPYTFCLLSCVSMVRRWIERTNYQGQIAYFFEAGHRHAREANFFMNEIPEAGDARIEKYRYLSHAFVDKRQAPPLQAADMLAWQHCHFHTRGLQGHSEMRKDFQAMLRPQDIARDYTRASIEKFREGLAEAHRIFPGMTPEQIEAVV